MPQAVETSGALTPEHLFEQLSGDGASEPLTVLDVRNQDEFESWRIEGRRPVRLVNIPYFDFIEDPEASVAKVPRVSGELTVVCAKGDSSAFSRGDPRRGRDPRAQPRRRDDRLGGDLHVAREVAVWPDRDAMLLQVQRVGKACLSYLLVSRGEALVVDPSRHLDRYLRLAADPGAGITQVIDTHLHADHVSGARPRRAGGGDVPHRPGGRRGRRLRARAPARRRRDPGGRRAREGPGPEHAGPHARQHLSARERPGAPHGRHALRRQRRPARPRRARRGVGGRPPRLALPAAGRPARRDARAPGPLRGAEGDRPRRPRGDPARLLEFVMAQMAAEPEGYQEIRQINLGRTSAPEDRVVELELGPNRCALGGRKAT